MRKRQCNGWKFTASETGGDGAAKIPFRHMVTAVQIADHSFDYLLTVLERGGYDVSDVEKVRQRSGNADKWLESFAPLY